MVSGRNQHSPLCSQRFIIGHMPFMTCCSVYLAPHFEFATKKSKKCFAILIICFASETHAPLWLLTGCSAFVIIVHRTHFSYEHSCVSQCVYNKEVYSISLGFNRKLCHIFATCSVKQFRQDIRLVSEARHFII